MPKVSDQTAFPRLAAIDIDGSEIVGLVTDPGGTPANASGALGTIFGALGVDLANVPPGTVDNVLGVDAGALVVQQNFLDLANSQIFPQPAVMDYGQARSLSTSELSLLTAVMPIGANVPAVNDQFEIEFGLAIVNLTGAPATSRIRGYLGANVPMDRTFSLNALTGLAVFGRILVTFKAVGGSSQIHAQSLLISGSGSAIGENFPQFPTSAAVFTTATTAAINVDVTVQHSVATNGLATTLYVASLRPRSRF